MEIKSPQTVDFFLGTTTPAGFKGYFRQLGQEPGMQLYLIKSGPGCGKSTMMKQLAQLSAGPVQRIHCSSDPDSLDGVVFCDKNAAILDATAPHTLEPLAPGADEVAVEFRSLSKTAGFTGLRCGYAVVPEKISARTADGRTLKLHDMWLRRQCTKYNGCPYIVQRAAEAVFLPETRQQLDAALSVYRKNADLMLDAFRRMGLSAFGGVHSPYVWLQTPENMPSWSFFDLMLEKAAVVCTPGVGFGASGEGYARFTAFNSPENTVKALERLEKAL